MQCIYANTLMFHPVIGGVSVIMRKQDIIVSDSYTETAISAITESLDKPHRKANMFRFAFF